MKILTWKEFCASPQGTIFLHPDSPYESLCRKEKTIYTEDGVPCDFFYSNLTAQVENGELQDVTEIQTRYALFDDSDFVVYEPKDIDLIQKMLR